MDLPGLPQDTSIKTSNQDARRFLIRRTRENRYNIVIGDVFNDQTTPYHLTTLEFHKLVKAHLEEDGVYIVNITDNYQHYGRYLASFVRTLEQAFTFVYLFSTHEVWGKGTSDFVILATDRYIDSDHYKKFVTRDGQRKAVGTIQDPVTLNQDVAQREPILLTDDHTPTDILVAPLFQ